MLNDIDFVWRQPEVDLLERLSVVAYWSRREELVVTLLGQNDADSQWDVKRREDKTEDAPVVRSFFQVAPAVGPGLC